MVLLDTDHLSVLAFPDSSKHVLLSNRIQDSEEEFGTTIVCIEELLRGWLALIHKKRDVHDQIAAYFALGKLWDFFRDWRILPFEQSSADTFKSLRRQKVRIGSQDLKIASIAFAHDALVLSANLRDFRQVPGLRVENWLEE